MFHYLGWHNKISHVPKPWFHIRYVGEGKTFDFGGESTDDRVCVLVALTHHTHIPACVQQYDMFKNTIQQQQVAIKSITKVYHGKPC